MATDEFIGGLKDVNEYLNRTTIEVPTNVVIDPTDPDNPVQVSKSSITLKELICSLLAGNGLKLGNLQVCLKVNLNRLLATVNENGLKDELGELYGALEDAEKAMDEFMEHTGIDEAFNRLNKIMSDIATISNLINFCATPINPKPIPNVLRQAFGSFTGNGKDILDGIGTMLDSDVGGCIGGDGGVNFGIFQGGALKDIGDVWDNILNSNVTDIQQELNRIKTNLDQSVTDMRNLMDLERNFSSANNHGGSMFTPVNRVNTDVGLITPVDGMSLSDANNVGSQLRTLYPQLKDYEVDENGKNIWYYLLEPELIAKLEAQDDNTVTPTERTTVYDYCGKPIGFTEEAVDEVTSTGTPVTTSTLPAQNTARTDPTLSAISLEELKQIVSESSDFTDFQNKINNL